MTTPSDALKRFHTAQGDGAGSVYARALQELRAGHKQSYWIWFVLPQLRGLGRSAMAEQ